MVVGGVDDPAPELFRLVALKPVFFIRLRRIVLVTFHSPVFANLARTRESLCSRTVSKPNFEIFP